MVVIWSLSVRHASLLTHPIPILCAPLRFRPAQVLTARSSTGLFTPFCYVVSYAVDQGIPSDTAFYVLAVLNAGSVLGRVAPAHFADAFGRFALLVPCAFLAGLSTLVLWPAAHSLVPLLAYAALYGLFSGAFNALIVPCIAQVSDIREIGLRIGMLYSILSFPYVVAALNLLARSINLLSP